MKIKLLFFLSLFLFITCQNQETKHEKLSSFLESKNYEIGKINSILFLSSTGCATCYKSFALLLKKYQNNKKTIIIVAEKGNRVNISSFLDSENIILDFDNQFIKSGFSENSTAFFLNNNKLDTVVEINAKNLKYSLNYISNRLD